MKPPVSIKSVIPGAAFGSSGGDARHWVFVFDWLTLGGAERQALIFADALIERGDRVSVVGLSTPGHISRICEQKGIPCYFWPFDFSKSKPAKLAAIASFAMKLRGLSPDYLAPYGMDSNLLCGVSWKVSGARSMVWQQRDEGRKRRSRWIERLAIRMIPAFISNSRHATTWLTDTLGVDESKVRVIRNGVRVPPESALLRPHRWGEQHGMHPEVRIVSMIANIHSYKDHMTLVKAWKIVVQQFDDPDRLMLVLAGNKQDRWPVVESWIRTQGLAERVYAPGMVENVEELLGSSEIVAFSSVNEGVPNGVLEAMSWGRPVVGSDYAGIRETGIGKFQEQLFRAGDVEECASKILYLLRNREQAKRIGTWNRNHVSQEFTVDGMVNGTLEVFGRQK